MVMVGNVVFIRKLIFMHDEEHLVQMVVQCGHLFKARIGSTFDTKTTLVRSFIMLAIPNIEI